MELNIRSDARTNEHNETKFVKGITNLLTKNAKKTLSQKANGEAQISLPYLP